MRMLAAPQDDLFAVGDEDQTLYGWRRASVQRMSISTRPTRRSTRHALEHNYRCTPEVVRGERRADRPQPAAVPQDDKPAPGRAPGGERAIRVAKYREAEDGEARADARAQTRAPRARRRSSCWLARSTRCGRTRSPRRRPGCGLAGPDELFESRGALETLQAYFAVFSDAVRGTRGARADHPAPPARGIPGSRCGAADLRQPAARARAAGGGRARCPLPPAHAGASARAAEKLAALDGITDAAAFIARLRRDGLDQHFEQTQKASARPDRDDLRALAEAEREADGQDPAAVRGAARRAAAAAAGSARRERNGHRAHDRPPRQRPPVAARRRGRRRRGDTAARATRSRPASASARLARDSRPSAAIAYVAFTRAQQRTLDPPHRGAPQPLPPRGGPRRRHPRRPRRTRASRAASAGFWRDVTRAPADGPKRDARGQHTRASRTRARGRSTPCAQRDRRPRRRARRGDAGGRRRPHRPRDPFGETDRATPAVARYRG